jgi:DNA-binding transcriptional ArsR family regulator
MRDRSVTNPRHAVFRALADPTRRAVLDLLRDGSRSAGEIARLFPMSRPAISKHLRRLRQAGLVRDDRRGRTRFYAINPAPLKKVDRWLTPYRDFWEGKLAEMRAFVESRFEGKKR